MSALPQERPSEFEERAAGPTEVERPAAEVREEKAVSYPLLGFSTLALILIVFVGLFGYSIHERNVARDLAKQNDQTSAALKDTRAQMDALNAKLDTLAAAQQPAPAPTHVARAHVAATAVHHSKPDPRWKKLQSEIDAQGKEIAETRNGIESTRQDLSSTRTELQGSIAKTHDELVVLQRKGERNYYEFDLDKAKQFTHAGPVGISLRKANAKHQYADLELMVNDRQMSKKHLNLFEPALFYPDDSQQPMQIVINNISKNHIRGYISTPKYRPAELAAMAGNTDQQTAAANAPADSASPQLRRR
jgi:hypothetical protein